MVALPTTERVASNLWLLAVRVKPRQCRWQGDSTDGNAECQVARTNAARLADTCRGGRTLLRAQGVYSPLGKVGDRISGVLFSEGLYDSDYGPVARPVSGGCALS